MTLENLKKLYKHYSFLSKGNFTAEDFYKEFGDGEDAGFSHVGKLPSDRRKLIIADAQRNLKELLKKYPELKEEEKPIKSKVKK